MGPVTPLLAVARAMRARRDDVKFVWAGTPDGPERAVVEAEGFAFYPVPVAKFPTYPSIRWFTWPFDYFRAVRVAREIVDRVRPVLVVSGGGFTGVPVIRYASRRGIPCAIHQLDAEPGRSNRIVARLCRSVTTSFQYDQPPFPGIASERVATPCRFASVTPPSRQDAAKYFDLDPDRPCVFITGGGTGALSLNEAIWNELLKLLAITQVIHVTGKGKGRPEIQYTGYVQAEFFDESTMLVAESLADVVVSRAGMGSIVEFVALKKSAILVPLPGHQEANAARVPFPVVTHGEHFSTRLHDAIIELLNNPDRQHEISLRASEALPVDDGSALAERWLREVRE